MNEGSLNSAPLLNAICMHCGYDISGTIPNPDGQVTCPECGVLLKPSTHPTMTARDVHMHIIKCLVLPFAIWAAITFTIVALMQMQSTLVAAITQLIFMLAYPVGLFAVMIAEWSALHRKLEPFPRPYPRWAIPLWIMAYTIPTASLYPLVFFVLQNVL